MGWDMIVDLATYTAIHTIISIVQLVSGFVVVYALLKSQSAPGWTLLYIVTAIATSVTGFGFPFVKFLPSHVFAIISLVLFALVILGRYVFHYAGAWRWIYAIGMVVTVYLDAFVAIFQSFLKIPAIHALAPTQSEPPFAIAQGVLLVIAVALIIAITIRFRPAAAVAA